MTDDINDHPNVYADIATDPAAQAVKELCDIGAGKKPAAIAKIAGDQELTNEQRRRIPYIVAFYHKPCYLCGAEPPCAKYLPWKTDDPVTPWKITPVCTECSMLVDVKQRLETALKEELA